MQVYIGIDWSEKKHDVVYMNREGAVMSSMVIEHSQAGMKKLETVNQKYGLKAEEVVIGLETAHNLLIDYLWSQNYGQIYVVPPSVVKGSEGRYGSSGSMHDPKAAQLIADILRTDRGRLQSWRPDTGLTRQMRAEVSLIIFLTKETTRLSNRLRSVLLRYYPAALEVFKTGLENHITLALIQEYPDPQAIGQVSLAEFTAFTKKHHYPQLRVAGCYARWQAQYPLASPDTIQTFQSEAVILAEMLLSVHHRELSERKKLYQLFTQHPDFAVFSSLPGAGDFLAPALCAKFGDDRLRFPDHASVQALAGTCPVTKSSGKSRWVHFRNACDREWRYICQLWAKSLLVTHQSPLATAYFEKIRPHCRSDSHAFRCLANRWIAVAWKLWHARTPYLPDYHFAQVSARSKPRK
jgi:transposase